MFFLNSISIILLTFIIQT